MIELSRSQNLASKLYRFSLRQLNVLWAFLKTQYAALTAKRKNHLSFAIKILFLFVCLIFVRTSVMQALGRIIALSEYRAIWTMNEKDALANNAFPGGKVIEWIDKNLPADSQFLIYRQAEFAYYVKNNWRYDFDPKIIDLYDLNSVDSTFNYLRERKLNYIFVPNYMTATLYNSPVVDLIGNPAYTREIYSHSGSRVFEVYEEPQNFNCDADPLQKEWVQGLIGAQATFERGGNGIYGPENTGVRSKNFMLFRDQGNIFKGHTSHPLGAGPTGDGNFLMVWPDDYRDRIALMNGFGPIHLAPSSTFPAGSVDSVHLKFDISGDGFLEIWLFEYDEIGAWKSRRLWDAILQEDNAPKEVSVQAQISNETTSFRFMVMNGGSAAGYANVKGIKNCRISSDDTNTNDLTTSLIPAKSWIVSPAATREDDTLSEGVNLYIGQDCYLLKLFCRRIINDNVASKLLVRDTPDGGVSFRVPISSGYSIFSGTPSTSPRTWWQCKLGRRGWYLERSPARNGLFERFFLWFINSQKPAGNKASDLNTVFSVDLVAAKNTQIYGIVTWKDSKNRKNCYFAGEQVTEGEFSKISWPLPIAQDARDISFALQTAHQINEFTAMELKSANLHIVETN